MIDAGDPYAAVARTLVARHGAIESQISALRWKRHGDEVAGAATFATVGLSERTAGGWLALGSAVSPVAQMTDRVWVCNGAWTTTCPGGSRTVSIIGGMANHELAASAIVQDDRATSVVDSPEQGMVVFLCHDPLDLRTARLLLRDIEDQTVWEGPLLST